MNRLARLGVFCVMLFVIASATVSAQTRVTLNQPMLISPGPDVQEFLDDQFRRAIQLAESSGRNLEVGYNGFGWRKAVRSPQISIDVMAMDTPESTLINFTATGPGGGVETYPYMMRWQPNMFRDIAGVLRYIEGKMIGNQRRASAPPVVFLDFKSDFISRGDLPFGDLVQLYPYSMNVGDEGEMLIGAGSYVVGVDQYFRETRKVGIDPTGMSIWASFVGTTSAGTVVGTSSTQSGITRIIPGLDLPMRIPTPGAVSSMALLGDGTVITVDSGRNIYRYEGTDRSELDLNLNEYTWITVVAAGPENTVWLWHPTQRAFMVVDSSGARVDFILPQIDQAEAPTISAFSVLADGTIFARGQAHLYRFDRDGSVIWRAPAETYADIGNFYFFNQTGFDGRTGHIYLVNIMERRIIQLLDVSYAEQTRRLTDTERALLDINERLKARPTDVPLIIERSRFFESIEAWELAASSWQNAVDLNPANNESRQGLIGAEVRLLRRQAAQATEKTLDIVERLGPASAQVSFGIAQRLYEQLISKAPDDVQARQDLQLLRERFNESSTQFMQQKPLTFVSVDIPELFPSMFARYQREPVGSLVIRNNLDEDASNVRISVDMRFLDFPFSTNIADKITAGEEIAAQFRVPLGRDVLTLEEDLPTPVNVRLSYFVGGVEQSFERQEIITVYRATALTWDDTRKIAAYVMPRESTVEEFALLTGRTGDAEERIDISAKVFRAARIADAVGTFGIEYIEDPDSGISNVLGVATVVDTVRFPRYTLRRRVGDCDDTTALLCSLYEAAGIQTAIMTSPGHIFMAFNTGEPEQNAWLFESDTTAVVRHAGTVWLPVETTILDQGFTSSWIEGSRLVNRYEASGDIEFLPVGDLRDDFPPLPLPSDNLSFQILPPGPDQVASLYDVTFGGLVDSIYESNVSELERGLSGQNSRRKVRTLNQIGILHARFNQPGRAEDRFEEAIRTDPENSAGYINLANLKLVAGDARGALGHLDDLERVKPDLTLASLLRAQAHFLLGDEADVRENMRLVEEKAPELAQNYPHLTTVSGAARASEAQGGSVMPWDIEGE